MEVGPLAGVEPLLMQSAFAEAVAYGRLADATLVIDEVPLTAVCPACGVVEVMPVRIACPGCGETQLALCGGDELRLRSVTIRGTRVQEQPA